MQYRDRAVETVQAAEQKLRSDLRPIILEAVEAEAYGDVAAIARIAAALSTLVMQVRSDSYGPAPELPSLDELFAANRQTTQEPVPEPAPGPEDQQQRRLLRAALPPPPPPRPRRVAGDYPRFFRDGDRLVKVAWSKKERRPYEHRAPRAAVQTLLDAIKKRKGEGKQFEAADVLPLVTPTGEEYPSYQSYLALSWLRHIGVVTKVGREGYVLKPKVATPEKLDELWSGLAASDSTD